MVRPQPIPNCPAYVSSFGSSMKLLMGLLSLSAMLLVRVVIPPSGAAPRPVLIKRDTPELLGIKTVKEIKTVPPELIKAEQDAFGPEPAHSFSWEDFKGRLFGRANAVKMMSLLKYYQVAQFVVYSEERGGHGPTFAAFPALFSSQTGPALSDPSFYRAWDGMSQPEAFQGYLFSDIEKDSQGQAIDRTKWAGLCAYPAKPSAGTPVILMLLDFTTMDQDQMWNFYTADSKRVPGAVKQWPAASDIGPVWTIKKKRSPQDALAEAQRLSDMASVAGVQLNPTPNVPYDPEHYLPHLHKVRTALQHRRDVAGSFPREAEGLRSLLQDDIGLVEKDFIDPWGTPYRYRLFTVTYSKGPMEEAEVISNGPDRQPNTADDLKASTEIRLPF